MLGSDAELDFMLADAGGDDNVAYGGQTTSGLLDVLAITQLSPEGMQMGERSITLGIRDGSLTDLVVDAAITVNDIAYTISDCGHPLADGMRLIALTPA